MNLFLIFLMALGFYLLEWLRFAADFAKQLYEDIFLFSYFIIMKISNIQKATKKNIISRCTQN